jgi:hypothetical protein
MRFLVILMLCLQLLGPAVASAQQAAANLKTPLSLSLAQYGVMLGTAILGGMVGWWIKVRRGELSPWSLSNLIGEMVISAFCGLLTFWVCTAYDVPELMAGTFCGMAGLMGAKGLDWVEKTGKAWAERKLGLSPEARP